MRELFLSFVNDESGGTAIEYSLCASLTGAIMIIGLHALGINLLGASTKV